MKLSIAQFRIVFNANVDKRLKGGWVQTAIDGGTDIPFKPSYFCNYYGYKKQSVKKGLGKQELVDVYDDIPRKEYTDDVVLIHKQWTFCFLRWDWNYVTKEGARRNLEMEEWFKNEMISSREKIEHLNSLEGTK